MKCLKLRISALALALAMLVSLAPAALAADASDALKETAQAQA